MNASDGTGRWRVLMVRLVAACLVATTTAGCGAVSDTPDCDTVAEDLRRQRITRERADAAKFTDPMQIVSISVHRVTEIAAPGLFSANRECHAEYAVTYEHDYPKELADYVETEPTVMKISRLICVSPAGWKSPAGLVGSC